MDVEHVTKRFHQPLDAMFMFTPERRPTAIHRKCGVSSQTLRPVNGA